MIKNLISVCITIIRFSILKIFKGNRFKFCGIQRFSPDTSVEIDSNAQLKLGQRVRAHTGTKIKVREGAIVKIGNNVAFNYNCLIVSRNKIIIGDGCEIGPGVLFYDHDHDVRNYLLEEGKYISNPIIVGKNVWIGANAIILRGSVIGDNSVIGAGTVVKGTVPNNSIIVQENRYRMLRNSARM